MMNNSEALFTFWQNTSLSDHDNQTEREFPQWRLVVSFLLLGLWLLSGSLTTALSFSVLLAVMKSSINRKLGLIHIYVLVMNIFVRVCTALAFSSLMPPVIRFCECSTMTNFISLYLLLFNICYQLYTLASLSVFQLMIIKGKKKFVNYKTIGITLLMITVLTIALPTVFFGVAINHTGGDVVCHNTIGCAGVDIAQLLSIITAFLIIIWVPSVSILVAATVWSCTIFKENYAGHDSGLSRRIVAMTLVMPVIVCFSNQYCSIYFIPSYRFCHSSHFGVQLLQSQLECIIKVYRDIIEWNC